MQSDALGWLREGGDKWNEQRGVHRLKSFTMSIAWQALATYLHPLARGERLSAVWDLVLWWPHSHGSRQVVVQDPCGGVLELPSAVGVKYLSLGLFQLPQKAFILHFAEPGDVMLDIGAYVGSFTIPMASRGAAVHAFEPVRASRAVLTRNVEINGFNELVTIYALALGDATGEARITSQFASGNRVPIEKTTSEQSELVQVVTLDTWAAGRDLNRLLLVKIDAEGMDEQVLAGAEETLRTYEPALIVEYMEGSAGLERKLTTLGYGAYRYDVRSKALRPSTSVRAGSGNVIACTPRRYRDLSTRLAAIRPEPLHRPTIGWATPAVQKQPEHQAL
jgi:FkbM family methyltransferase